MTFSRSEDSRPLKTMMPHVIRNENPAYYDPESTLVMVPKVCLMHWTMIYHRMTENPRRAMCRPRWCPHNRNAADAMTKFKGAHSEPLFTLLLRTGMYTLKGDKSELADRAILRQVWNCATTQGERSQISDGTSFFFVHVPSDRGDLFQGYMRGEPCRILFFVTPSIVHSRCVIR